MEVSAFCTATWHITPQVNPSGCGEEEGDGKGWWSARMWAHTGDSSEVGRVGCVDHNQGSGAGCCPRVVWV